MLKMINVECSCGSREVLIKCLYADIKTGEVVVCGICLECNDDVIGRFRPSIFMDGISVEKVF